MTYELAKQLKDAGFKQPMMECFAIRELAHSKNYSDSIGIPTLSELIEACGDEFRSLRKEDENWWAISVYADRHVKGARTIKGDTAEEAVAKLWLELNKDGKSH